MMKIFPIAETTPKFIAVLRGITPEQAEEVGGALYEAGIRIMEVTLNSPKPYDSIRILKKSLPSDTFLGAGTVTETAQIQKVKDAGGTLIISPHMDESIIRATRAENMISIPGVFSPTETLRAILSGAHALKFFPASVLGIDGLKAISAVIPKDFPVIVVGGVHPENMGNYLKNGYHWFGLGNNLFSAGDSLEDTRTKAKKLVEAYRKASEKY